jgi:hypothetical protein
MTSTLTPNAAATSGDGASSPTEPRAAHVPACEAQHREAQREVQQLPLTDLHTAKVELCQPDQRRERQRVRAFEHRHAVFRHDRHAERRDQRHEDVATTQRTDDEPFQCQTEKTGPDSAADQRDDDVVGDVERRGEAGEHADHEDVGMGEVDHP